MISLVLVSVHVRARIMETEGGTAGFGSPSVAGQSRARVGGEGLQMRLEFVCVRLALIGHWETRGGDSTVRGDGDLSRPERGTLGQGHGAGQLQKRKRGTEGGVAAPLGASLAGVEEEDAGRKHTLIRTHSYMMRWREGALLSLSRCWSGTSSCGSLFLPFVDLGVERVLSLSVLFSAATRAALRLPKRVVRGGVCGVRGGVTNVGG